MEASLRSFEKMTTYENARMTVVFDAVSSYSTLPEAEQRVGAMETIISSGELAALASSVSKKWSEGTIIFHEENMGLGPSVNEALGLIFQKNRWHEERGEVGKVSQLICYVQDDILYTDGWLQKLVKNFLRFEGPMKLGFASGYRSPEHEKTIRHPSLPSVDGEEMRIQDWIRMTNMLGRTNYWKLMWPIHGRDPERSNALRAKPNDGIGSGCDWWFLRDTEHSVCNTGRTNLVIPGLLAHLGHADSTWLSQDLEEHPQDLRLIDEHVR